MGSAVFREVEELKSTQKDEFALPTSSVLSLCKPLISLLVTLDAGFHIQFSDKMLTPKSEAASKGCPAHTRGSSLCVQMGLTQIVSVYESQIRVPGSHILSKVAGEGQIQTEVI